MASLSLSACYSGLHELADVDELPEADGLPEASSDGGEGPAPDGVDASCIEMDVLDSSDAPLRRLTRAEYRNNIEDLLDVGDAAQAPLNSLNALIDESAGGFAVVTQAPDEQVVRKYMEVAEELAAVYVEQRLPQVLACEWAEPECVEQLLVDLGRRAFRRPLNDSEMAAYLELHSFLLAEDGADVAVTGVVNALLSSPNFLYREEAVDPDRREGELLRLEPYSLASRISFLVWASGPDDELLDAAADGRLDHTDGVRDEVERMMSDPRFGRTLRNFYQQWMSLEQLDGVDRDDPAWSDQLRDSMRDETLRFVEHLYLQGDGRLNTLLGASYTFVDDDLAALYGVSPPEEQWSRVELDPQERSGLLTHASMLTQFGTVFPEVHRGKFVLRQLLCGSMPEPSEELELDPDVNRLETNPCAACHVPTDSIGFGLSRYDSMGRFRSVGDDGSTIDDQGTLIANLISGDDDLNFNGGRELAELLVDEPVVGLCLAKQWSRYAMGRRESIADRCALEAFSTELASSDGDLRQLVLDITTSTWFASRAVTEFEESE